MTDNTELRRLAEAAPSGPWIAENDSLYFKDDGYTRHLLDADAGHDVEDEAYYAALNFIAAANPAAVRALLDDLDQARNGMKYACAMRLKKEIDRLRDENQELRKDAEQWRALVERAKSPMGKEPQLCVPDAGTGMLPPRLQKHGRAGEVYRCPSHSGSHCSLCGGSGYRSICNQTACHEHGCQAKGCASSAEDFERQQRNEVTP
ncbi:ead/Ea22-like family protein [Pseudomonas sp. Z1-14]|uniref:ead/Ea22-like family protein n=1 Tax=Pseudomonas sp. Z1-14 TaxID=2817409 RepID=UPI003DA8F027